MLKILILSILCKRLVMSWRFPSTPWVPDGSSHSIERDRAIDPTPLAKGDSKACDLQAYVAWVRIPPRRIQAVGRKGLHTERVAIWTSPWPPATGLSTLRPCLSRSKFREPQDARNPDCEYRMQKTCVVAAFSSHTSGAGRLRFATNDKLCIIQIMNRL